MSVMAFSKYSKTVTVSNRDPRARGKEIRGKELRGTMEGGGSAPVRQWEKSKR